MANFQLFGLISWMFSWMVLLNLSINAHFIGFLWYSHFKNMISAHLGKDSEIHQQHQSQDILVCHNLYILPKMYLTFSTIQALIWAVLQFLRCFFKMRAFLIQVYLSDLYPPVPQMWPTISPKCNWCNTPANTIPR